MEVVNTVLNVAKKDFSLVTEELLGFIKERTLDKKVSLILKLKKWTFCNGVCFYRYNLNLNFDYYYYYDLYYLPHVNSLQGSFQQTLVFMIYDSSNNFYSKIFKTF